MSTARKDTRTNGGAPFDPSLDGRYSGRMNDLGNDRDGMSAINVIDAGDGAFRIATNERLILEATEGRLDYSLNFNAKSLRKDGVVACMVPSDALLRLLATACLIAMNTSDHEEEAMAVEVMRALMFSPTTHSYLSQVVDKKLDMSREGDAEAAYILGVMHEYCGTPLGKSGSTDYPVEAYDYDELFAPLGRGLGSDEIIASYICGNNEAQRIVLNLLDVIDDTKGRSVKERSRATTLIGAFRRHDEVVKAMDELMQDCDAFDFDSILDDNGEIMWDDLNEAQWGYLVDQMTLDNYEDILSTLDEIAEESHLARIERSKAVRVVKL